MERPISKLPNILYPPIWGKFLKMHIDNEPKVVDPQLLRYRCTYKHTAIYKAGTYYYCFGIRRGYRNLSALKRLL